MQNIVGIVGWVSVKHSGNGYVATGKLAHEFDVKSKLTIRKLAAAASGCSVVTLAYSTVLYSVT